jgi:hypothetical protein
MKLSSLRRDILEACNLKSLICPLSFAFKNVTLLKNNAEGNTA